MLGSGFPTPGSDCGRPATAEAVAGALAASGGDGWLPVLSGNLAIRLVDKVVAGGRLRQMLGAAAAVSFPGVDHASAGGLRHRAALAACRGFIEEWGNDCRCTPSIIAGESSNGSARCGGGRHYRCAPPTFAGESVSSFARCGSDRHPPPYV
jgi:stage V sporulation protein SpoVS